MEAASQSPAPPVFEERPRALVVPDAWVFAVPAAVLGAVLVAVGQEVLGALALVLAAFAVLFFRNPWRPLPADPRAVVAPADGRVIEAGETELEGGGKALRVGIFLSIFDVHVNRAPVSGRVVDVRRGGEGFLAAFDPKARDRNVRLALDLETAEGLRVSVVQITGLVARRIVCHPKVGEWLARGTRYGLIRFGSRTDVILPAGSTLRVGAGQRVAGGRDVVAELPAAGGTS